MNLEQLLLEVLLEAEDSQSYKAALKNTGKDIKDGAKQLINVANDAGAAALQKLKDSEALKKAKEELSDPKNRKAVATKGKKAIGTILKVLNSTMDTEKKRNFLKKYIVSNTFIGLGLAAELWDKVRREVKDATDFSENIPFVGNVNTGGGINLPDPEWLNIMGEALPYLVAIRVLMVLYAGKDAYFSKKDVEEGEINENQDLITPEMETAILKGLERSLTQS
jgi:hypothetical protein